MTTQGQPQLNNTDVHDLPSAAEGVVDSALMKILRAIPCHHAPNPDCRYREEVDGQQRQYASMEVKLASVSVGCNKSANCLDWGCRSLLAYGAHNQVVLYDDEVRARVLAALPDEREVPAAAM